jgi:hypothetical protein
MHNIAERGRFDQQNARELGGSKIRRVHVVRRSIADLTI